MSAPGCAAGLAGTVAIGSDPGRHDPVASLQHSGNEVFHDVFQGRTTGTIRVMSKARKSAILMVAALGLGGCSSLGNLFGSDEVVKVSEVGRAMNCAAPTADTSLQMFASADAVRDWQRGNGLELIGDQAMLPGMYVLVELGQRTTGGYGIVIGPEAQVDDKRLGLLGTFFEPDVNAMASQVMNSPCVLIRLPAGNWQGVDLYDQSGKRRARTAAP
ncbi:protease complex subunit PrcB family protein [Solimonas terrae]|uniref:Protease complex subunit PrcB family protein n=1 Tax=Solimonas terrae TaxID=1396819 RepID=A0A6M2BTR1_9GAMM|nr:protease complex subunit PrcB family protein [Solimonas terrae]NGY05357.1 protease complex subunit PrcB family protein [Solimonas terrae]